MSSWEEFKTDASKLASKVATKTGELADAAAMQVRRQTIKLRLCEEYERLGRLTYASARGNAEQPDCTAVLEAIDELRRQLDELGEKPHQEQEQEQEQK